MNFQNFGNKWENHFENAKNLLVTNLQKKKALHIHIIQDDDIDILMIDELGDLDFNDL